MKKGFTLVELLAVIVLMAALALITIPIVDSTLKRQKDKLYEVALREVKDALKLYGDDHIEELPDSYEELTITLAKLKQEGYIRNDFKNPKTDACFSNANTVTISNVGGRYGYEVDELVDGTSVDCNSVYAPVELVSDNDNSHSLTYGDKVCIGTECFYVISKNNGIVRMLSEYNLKVGYNYYDKNGSETFTEGPDWDTYFDSNYNAEILDEGIIDQINSSYIMQDSKMRGFIWYSSKKMQNKGVVRFSATSFPAEQYVYSSSVDIYEYVNSYVENLKEITGIVNISGGLVDSNDLSNMSCSISSERCTRNDFSISTSYWTGMSTDTEDVYAIRTSIGVYDIGYLRDEYANAIAFYGVRPVIIIQESNIIGG